MNLCEHIERQINFSLKTFGPGNRTDAIIDHIKKELAEIKADPTDLGEWVDLILLSIDGAWRAGHTPLAICCGLMSKLVINEQRVWPDWRTADPTKAIEHVRGGDAYVQVTD